MNIGKLKHRVAVQQMTETRDSTGEMVETWTTIATRFAHVQPVSGKESDRRGIETATARYKVTMRYQAGLITTADRLLYESQPLDIESVINVDEAGTTYEVSCFARS